MPEITLRIQILRQLLDAHALNRELRPRDIKEILWPIAESKEKGLEEDTFRIQILRELGRLEEEGLIQVRKVPRKKDRQARKSLYSIKNETYARLILEMDNMGWDLSRKRASLELPMEISAKNYEELIPKLSKAILDIVLLRKTFPYTHTRFSRPIIFDFSIPISQEKGNILRNKILIMTPDEKSVAKRSFTEEQFKDLMLYLTRAWVLYFEERRITHNNIVISHFTKQQAERLRRIVEFGKAKTVDDVVHLATLNYLDTYDPSRKQLLIKTSGPVVKMAIEKGIYKNKREFIEAAIKEHKKRLAEKLAEELRHTIE